MTVSVDRNVRGFHLKRLLWIAILFASFAGNSIMAQDGASEIDQLVERLSKSHQWRNGVYPVIKLPETANQQAVIKATLNAYYRRDVSFVILASKQVNIPGALPQSYTAVSVSVEHENKIILYQYTSRTLGWWTRIYAFKP